MFDSRQVALSTTPVELTVFDANRTSNLHRTNDVAVLVTADVDMFVGGPAVTTATGYKVPAGQPFSSDCKPGDRLYAVLASGAGTAFVLRSGV